MDANTFPAGLHVLAVDDSRVCLKILERQLKCCNYNVTAVMDARTALDMLRERKDGNQFDLVISDVVMPNMDGFKLLELIGLEMDLPVIMLSANSETETIVKGIKHGACDYFVKPVRIEQIRDIWKHVVKNRKTDPLNSISSGSDDDVQKLPSGDANKGEKKKYSKKNKKPMDVADEDGENASAQKKQRVRWSGQLHRKFVEAVSQTGIDAAVPKKILQIMKVEGLTRENVASHLQKYRIYLRKLGDGTLRYSNPFAEETEALWKNMNDPSFIGSPSSSNQLSKMNSSSAIGTQTLQPKYVVPMPEQDNSRFISSGKSYAPVSSGGLPGASQCFPSGPSSSSVLNARKHSSVDISGSSFANSLSESQTLTSNLSISSSHSFSSYANILRGKILGSSRGIPFEDIESGDILAPSGHLPLQSSELVKQPSVQQFNEVAREVHQFAGPSNSLKAVVPSKFSNLGHNVGMFEGPMQGNVFKINQLSRLARSSGQVTTFGNEDQNRIANIMRIREQVAPFSFGNDTHSALTPVGNTALPSSSSTRPELQINNSDIPTQVLNGGGANDNLHEGSTVNHHVVSDQVNNINEFLMGTGEAQNGESDDLDDFLASLIDKDFGNNGESFIDGDWDFAP